ncbi:hypothetical protein IWQ56_007241 [Coemansia nantahalensis]|uniref:Uncharacterized protein n=1 Tax=Coemansia helicoidea TaxID=1286919 RepID=A0ACC1L5Q4_9FUNG|nr:hypothetical protein IWQ56_007241 [Coemansia nantahalensis]KAJ2800943.1 hypothetical protein H4R21_002983 [Coemansia helicoidea]
MSEHTVSLQAYAKAVLHCAKYPWAAVHGLLLTEKRDGKIRHVDAVPLAHTWTELAPMFDVALQQAQRFAASKGLSVGGYYAAYEDPSETELSAAGALLANAVLAQNADAVAFVLDAKQLAPGSTNPGLVPYVSADSQWRRAEFAGAKRAAGAVFSLENSRVLAATQTLVAERAEIAVHDFDEHLGDTSLDWLLNPVLSERIRAAS